jgi:hypothetical protein
MATRNPMNQRYQGDGPGGQTRKSASSAKPTSKAAASVHVKKKPQTASEKRAAKKAQEREAEQKAKVRAQKAAEKAKASDVVVEEPKKAPEKKVGGFFSNPEATAAKYGPRAEEYKKWRRIYWYLLGLGVVIIAVSFMMTNTVGYDNPIIWVLIVSSYAVIIAAFFIDFRKVKPIMKMEREGSLGKKTPKALKHEQEAREQAQALEAARKAARESRKPSLRKPKDTVVPGEEGTQAKGEVPGMEEALEQEED